MQAQNGEEGSSQGSGAELVQIAHVRNYSLVFSLRLHRPGKGTGQWCSEGGREAGPPNTLTLFIFLSFSLFFGSAPVLIT